MRTCKPALALIFLLATPFSATAQQMQLDLKKSANPQTTSSIAPSYTAISPRNDVIVRPAKESAKLGSTDLSENSWDFTDPGSVPGFGPMRPNDNYLELMTRALEK